MLKRLVLILIAMTFSLGIVVRHHSIAVAQEASHGTYPILLGIYPPSFMGDRQILNREVSQIGQWAGKRFSLVGSFIDIETHNPAYDIPVSLELLRTGYTGFINLTSTRTMAEIARGKADRGLIKIARAYADWSSQGNRLSFIAPFPEMNGAWESYGEDPVNFKLAYQRVQNIFTRAGVKSDAVRWVFAPNGWSPEKDRFEYYYPESDADGANAPASRRDFEPLGSVSWGFPRRAEGSDRRPRRLGRKASAATASRSDRVDVVAFSGYNWGYCDNAAWKYWTQPQEVYQPYIKRLQQLAPHKPIFIAQTATISYTSAGSQSGVKNRWLQNTYAYLASEAQVKGIIYFNIDKECDWQLFDDRGDKFTGYTKAIANPAFGYLSPRNLARTKLELSVPSGETDAA